MLPTTRRRRAEFPCRRAARNRVTQTSVVAGTLPYLPDWRSISTKSIMKIRIAQTMKVPRMRSGSGGRLEFERQRAHRGVIPLSAVCAAERQAMAAAPLLCREPRPRASQPVRYAGAPRGGH